MQNGQGVPNSLHALRDVDAGGLKVAIWVLIAMVVVVVVFVACNGALKMLAFLPYMGQNVPCLVSETCFSSQTFL